jgi:hypothetical protein
MKTRMEMLSDAISGMTSKLNTAPAGVKVSIRSVMKNDKRVESKSIHPAFLSSRRRKKLG